MMEARIPEFAELSSGRDEVERAIDRWVWYAGFADKLSQVLGGANAVSGPYFNFTVPEPTGVVAIVAPEEPPLLGLVSRIAPALVGGNAVVAIASETMANTVGRSGDELTPGWADRAAGRLGPLDEEALERLRVLRDAVRSVLVARAADQHPSGADLDELNAAAALSPGYDQIDWPPGVMPRRWTARGGGGAADALLAAVARSAIDLLTGPWSERVRRCEAPGCPRLFVARDARRRWCSSATCGNRVRVARHAARRRGDVYRLR